MRWQVVKAQLIAVATLVWMIAPTTNCDHTPAQINGSTKLGYYSVVNYVTLNLGCSFALSFFRALRSHFGVEFWCWCVCV